MLKAHGVDRLVDVRTVPHSRHNPQYERDALSEALQRDHLGYTHMPGLGGLRHPRKGVDDEPGLAQFELSRIRRLHADSRICSPTGGAD